MCVCVCVCMCVCVCRPVFASRRRRGGQTAEQVTNHRHYLYLFNDLLVCIYVVSICDIFYNMYLSTRPLSIQCFAEMCVRIYVSTRLLSIHDLLRCIYECMHVCMYMYYLYLFNHVLATHMTYINLSISLSIY